jgi:glycosyltransferase involved in cell wall biosynthesis
LIILNVNNSLDPRDGGQSERTYQMSRALAFAGNDVEVLVTDKGLTRDRATAILPARVLGLRTLSRRLYIPRLSLRKLRRIVEQQDVIHLMGYWSVLNPIVSHLARSSGKPVVIFPAGSWRNFWRTKAIKRAFHVAVGRRIVRSAAQHIAISREEERLFISYGVSPERITVIPNAVDPDEYTDKDDAAFRRKFQIGERPFILFLGRLNRIKGPDLLLAAYQQADLEVHAFDLVFAGSDEGLQEELRSHAIEAGLGDRVHFIGHISGTDKSRALHAAAYMAIPSRHKAMSIVFLASGASGTPVLATDRCGLDDVEGEGGGIVVGADPAAIRRGLERMARADLAAMGIKLRQSVLAKYTWKTVARLYQSLYQRIVSGDLARKDST